MKRKKAGRFPAAEEDELAYRIVRNKYLEAAEYKSEKIR